MKKLRLFISFILLNQLSLFAQDAQPEPEPDPKTKEKITIPPHISIKFTSGKELKNAVRNKE